MGSWNIPQMGTLRLLLFKFFFSQKIAKPTKDYEFQISSGIAENRLSSLIYAYVFDSQF